MQQSPGGSFGWRGWLGVLVGLASFAGFIAGVFALGNLAGLHGEKPNPKPSVSYLSNRDYAYWFCWNTGAPRPHHLGHRSTSDHVCSEDELRGSTLGP